MVAEYATLATRPLLHCGKMLSQYYVFLNSSGTLSISIFELSILSVNEMSILKQTDRYFKLIFVKIIHWEN